MNRAVQLQYSCCMLFMKSVNILQEVMTVMAILIVVGDGGNDGCCCGWVGDGLNCDTGSKA